MALPDDTAVPFTWGAGGARMTPEQIAAQRKVADALAAQAGDYSPVRSWTQGLARVAQGASAGLDYREAANADKANSDENKATIEKLAALLPGGGAASPSASIASAGTVPAAVAAVPVAPVAGNTSAPRSTTASEIATGSDGTKIPIYGSWANPDVPSPMDPPSGQDRVNMIATALGEEKPGSPEGLGAINTIRTRAVDGGYGGDTPTAVVLAPKQYSSMTDPAHRAALLARATANTPEVAKVSDAIDQAYGTGKYVNAGPNDPTEGKTHFYDPGSMVPVNAVPSWAQGREAQRIGNTMFLDDPDDPAAKPVQVASAGGVTPGVATVAAAADPAALPTNAAPTQGYAIPGQPAAAPSPGVTKVAGAINPAVIQAYTSPYSSASTKAFAGMVLQKQIAEGSKEHYTPHTDAEGNQYDLGSDGKRVMFSAADKSTPAQKDYEYYKKTFVPTDQQTTPMGFDTWTTAKAKAAATNLSNIGNVDMNSGQTYDKQLAEGLGKSHAALANGVEDAQTRARDIAAMQGAVDAIQKNNGTTGGMGAQQRLDLQKTINAGASALGIDKPFDESDLSDKEFLTKFNRSMAGAQAKNAVGSRVTNFEMSNFLKANPGLDMTITGNQRLLGIQGQIEQRNIAVGNAIREATAGAISSGKKIDPVTVQKIITDYDTAHHVQDPVSGQDLTQSYALPEFQQAGQGTNASLAAGHTANVGKIRRFNPVTGAIE